MKCDSSYHITVAFNMHGVLLLARKPKHSFSWLDNFTQSKTLKINSTGPTHFFPLNYLKINQSIMKFICPGRSPSTAPALIVPMRSPERSDFRMSWFSLFFCFICVFIYLDLFLCTSSVLPSLSQDEVPDEEEQKLRRRFWVGQATAFTYIP